MRFSHSLLLASVAILALPSCSSAKGPGEVGTKNDIVVRNFGDAPPPPSEDMLMQEAATPPEMMAARTLQGDVPEIDDSEARALAAQHEAEVAAHAPHADAVQAQMQATQQTELAAQRQAEQLQQQVQQHAPQQAGQQLQQQGDAHIPRAPEPTQMQRQAMDAQQQLLQQQGGVEAVPAPVVNQAPALAEQATQTMPVHDRMEAVDDTMRAGVTGYAGVAPQVDAGLDQRAPAAAMGAATADVMAPSVAQAATEFQDQPVDQAAQQALQNPPTSAVNVVQEQQQTHQQQQPVTHQAQPAAVPAPAPAPAAPSSQPVMPTSADIAAGGMRVVVTERGKPVIGQTLVPPAAAPADEEISSPIAPPTAHEPVPHAAPTIDRAMISRAQSVLAEKGFYTGPVDGEMTTATLNALSRYQSAHFLTPGGMTVETAQHLGLIQ